MRLLADNDFIAQDGIPPDVYVVPDRRAFSDPYVILDQR
jgi:hypothetical protein